MFLSISTTHRPATDLGYLLHKHPDRLHSVALPFGRAIMAYPEADEWRCTFTLSVEVDPVAMVRERDGGPDAYVNDRPYAASSFLSTALAKCVGTARSGRCEARPDLVSLPIPLEVRVAGVKDGEDGTLARRMFGPLGYDVTYDPIVVGSPVGAIACGAGVLGLSVVAPLRDVLDHLYVLTMAVDGDRHTFVDEADLARTVDASPWIAAHPDRDLIVRRLSKGLRNLADRAIATMDGSAFAHPPSPPELDALGATLDARRRNFVVERVVAYGDDVVADLGCGEGKLLRRVADMPKVRRWLAVDASAPTLARLRSGLSEGRFRVPERVDVSVLQGMLTAVDARLRGVGTAVMAEVIEHVDPSRIEALTTSVLGHARPRRLVVTTPNREYNAVWGIADGDLRHPDHRFEWTRSEFEAWVVASASAHGYGFEIHGIGDEHPERGHPTQAVVFSATEGSDA